MVKTTPNLLDEEAEKFKTQGNELFKQGDYESAINFYTKSIEADPENSIYFSNRARCYKMLQDYQNCLQDAQDSIHCDNTNLKAHLLLGQSLCMLAKATGEISKILTGIERMRKAMALCSSQKVRSFEYEIEVSIRRALKLKWMMETEILVQQRKQLIERVEKELEGKSDPSEAKVHIERLKSILIPTTKFKRSDIPEYFICPLTNEMLVQPVINEFGNTYEKKKYIDVTALKKQDPLTGQPLIQNVMYDNLAVKASIDYYLEK